MVENEKRVWGQSEEMDAVHYEVGKAELENLVLEGGVGGSEEPRPNEALSTCKKKNSDYV